MRRRRLVRSRTRLSFNKLQVIMCASIVHFSVLRYRIASVFEVFSAVIPDVFVPPRVLLILVPRARGDEQHPELRPLRLRSTLPVNPSMGEHSTRPSGHLRPGRALSTLGRRANVREREVGSRGSL